jgi:ABC-2 type transport system permease protein
MLLATVLVAKQVLAGTTFIVAGIALIAGLYFPVTLLPDWIQWASDVQPFTPAVDLFRWALVGRPLQDSALLDVLRIIGFAAVLLPLAVLLLRAAVRFAQGRGTIIEY